MTTLANHDGSPLIVSGENTNKVETYDMSANKWTELADYPYHDSYVFFNVSTCQKYFSIYGYATVTTNQGALIIGGDAGPKVVTVACYNNSGWSRLDDLQSARGNHRAIINGDKVYVIGGQNLQ